MAITENFRVNAILSAYDACLNRIENDLSLDPAVEAESVRLFALAVNSASSDDEIDELKRIFTPGYTTNLVSHFNSLGEDGSVFALRSR